MSVRNSKKMNNFASRITITQGFDEQLKNKRLCLLLTITTSPVSALSFA